jgi:endonuclease G, mitochondrial
MRLRQDDIDASEERRTGTPPTVVPPHSNGGSTPPLDPEVERTITTDPDVQEAVRVRARAMRAHRTTTTVALESERTLGANDLVAESYLELALLAAQPVCRVSVRSADGAFGGHATGFLVAPHILLTNWHVFRSRDEARNSVVDFDYRQDLSGVESPGVRFALRADAFFMNDQGLDYALVAVAPVSEDGRTPLSRYGYHCLGSRADSGRWMTIIQHPSGQPRKFAIRENESAPSPDGVDDPRFLWYLSDTAQGSSGAPVFNDSFCVVALHHYGRARRQNGKYVLRDGRLVDSLDGIEDTEVDWAINEGVRTSGVVTHVRERLAADATLAASSHAHELLTALDGGGDIVARARGGEFRRGSEAVSVPPPEAHRVPVDGLQFSVGHISVGQMFVGGQPTITPPVAPAIMRPAIAPSSMPAPASDLFEEKTKPPILDTRYSNRRGYRPAFLGNGFPVGLPRVLDESVVSRMDDGDHVLPYQHFSIVMNKRRRLAIFTAANIDYRSAVHPKGSDYTRKALGGYAENDREEWVTDPRIPESHQLPDRFYNLDRQGFDKGHITRREDVCFGSTFAVIRRANGDTYHVTNCSPQVKGFNQSGAGGSWGLLENHVQGESARERLCLFAGPIFDDDDPVFHGQDKRGDVQVQIPQSFWKVVVAREGDQLAAFGFVLEQDLSEVRFTEAEFDVTEAWIEAMIPIAELGELVGLEFPEEILAADRYDKIGDPELERTRVRRFGRGDEPPPAPQTPPPRARRKTAARA